MSRPSSLTPTDPGLIGPIQARVLEVARSLIGQREEPGNQGEIVRRVCSPFLSANDFTRLYRAGKLAWCAGFASYCWLMAWPGFRRYASVDCDSLWLRQAAAGWTRRVGNALLEPQPGDLLFFHAKTDHGDVNHVEVVVRADAKTVHTIGGNVRITPDDTGSVAEQHHVLSNPLIHGCATPEP